MGKNHQVDGMNHTISDDDTMTIKVSLKTVVEAITNDFYSEGFTLAKARAIVNVGVGKGSLSELEEPYHEGLRHYDNQSVVKTSRCGNHQRLLQ